jgi:hypothetical protein
VRAWSRKRGAGSRNCYQNSRNKGFPLKIEFFKANFLEIFIFSENLDLSLWIQESLQ